MQVTNYESNNVLIDVFRNVEMSGYLNVQVRDETQDAYIYFFHSASVYLQHFISSSPALTPI